MRLERISAAMSLFARSAQIFALTALLCVNLPSLLLAAPPKPTPPPARKGRDIQVIDGQWKFLTDASRAGEAGGWQKAIPADARTTSLPALWGADAAPNYTGVAWYWREFETKAGWKGQTVRLRFEAAAENTQVWLNGEKLGEHTGGATPFEFNITKPVKIGQKNLVAVRVEGSAKAGAGLWQGVLLMAHDEAYINDVFSQGDTHGRMTAAINLLNTSDKTGDSTLEARVIALNAPAKELKRTLQNLHLTPALNLTNLLLSVRGKPLKLWSPEQPFLYSLQLVFRQDADILDTQEVIFGFREFGYANETLQINGESLKPTSLVLSLDRPIVLATTEDTAHLREIFLRARNAGVNILYLDAPPPALLRMADETGMLIIEGARPKQKAQAMEDEINALILRDRSHPCILAWNLSDAKDTLVQSVRQLDPTRFLLAGSSTSRKLYAPNQTAPVLLPEGLLPKP